jgi:N6-adenosine-specific RNA methylase IME4
LNGGGIIAVDWPTKKYGAILADPPWTYYTWTAKGGHKSASAHYKTMPTEAICALPVYDLAADDCVLFLWATYPNLPDAFRVIEAWGFRYKTVAFTWIKMNKDGSPFLGLGYWTRANAEICLLATRGNPKRKAKDVPQVILAARREHSRKPDEQYNRIMRLVEGPYIELFARQQWPGWDAWGLEVGKFLPSKCNV